MDMPEFLTVREFLHRYSVGRTTFYREAKLGRLRLRKLGVSPIPLDFKAARAESFPAVAIYDAKRKAAIRKRLNGIIHPIALSRCGANSRLPAVMDVDFPFHLYGLH